VRAAVDAELDERALVDQQREALARRELVLLVLAGDLFLAAAEPGMGTTLVEVIDERAKRGPRDKAVGGCAVGGGHGK
jgi:hypothetical protein